MTSETARSRTSTGRPEALARPEPGGAVAAVDRREVEGVLRMARAYAAERLPWFAPALFTARLVITESCPCLAAIDDGMRVYFHPRFVHDMVRHTQLNRVVTELAWVWVHEISHFLREHRDRARERNADARRWNVAADLEINDARWHGLEPPSSWPPLLPGTYRLPEGNLAEYYYQHLPIKSLESESYAATVVWGDEGSGVHGQARSWEVHTQTDSVSTLEQKTVRLGVAQALEQSKSRGDVPAGWLRWAAQALRPQVNWREQLRRRVRGALTLGMGGRLDYTYQRPSRRASAFAPLVCPSLRGDHVPRIACVVDTSGSMSQRDLCQCMTEVRGVLDAMRTPVTVIPCDAVAYEPVRVLTQTQSLHVQLKGGGGTDMVAGIESALGLTPPPHVVIVLTDGWTPYPPRRYTTPVIFGILSGRSGLHAPVPPMPPWTPGDVVPISIDVR